MSFVFTKLHKNTKRKFLFRLKCLSTNIDCISNKMDEISCITLRLHPDIIALTDCYLCQYIADPTRIREGQYYNTLDLVFTNEEHMRENLQIEPPLKMSDHVGLFLKISCHTSRVIGQNTKICGIKVTIIV